MLVNCCDPMYKESQQVTPDQDQQTLVQPASDIAAQDSETIVAGPESEAASELEQDFDANSPAAWDKLWTIEGDDTWRKKMLRGIYQRIAKVVPADAHVVDLGGGIGILAEQLKTDARAVEVWDHSQVAVDACKTKGIPASLVDLEDVRQHPCISATDGRQVVVVGTEILEHLSDEGLCYVLSLAATSGQALFSVPNNCLGPEEESQHKRMFTALSFKQTLEQYFKHVRVECIGRWHLLGVCGFPKGFTLSVTFPARNEQDNIERTLASFRGVADEMVIGIDPRSADKTEEIARRYAEKVFILKEPEGVGEEKSPDGGVHFAHIRNQCLDECKSDWIFMTEAHERLGGGQDVLLALSKVVPPGAKMGVVLRTGQGQRWAFPWLIRNLPEIRYKRRTHNVVDFPEGTPAVRCPQIFTIHERSHQNAVARKEQRRVQNRKTLFEDWVVNHNEQSLYYFASEMRDFSTDKAIERLEQLLALPSKLGAMRYQARLILAKEYMKRRQLEDAKRVLLAAPSDDWSRGEHWLWLGDIAFDAEQYEEALQWYRYLGTSVGEPPWTVWWIDLYTYGHIAAQRLAMCYSALGRLKEGLAWARKTLELLPDESPQAARDECEVNIRSLEEALGETASKES